MYRVIKFFTDLQDNNHPYNPGDIYPRIGMDAVPGRIEELSTNKNRHHTPLIMLIGVDEKEEEPNEEPRRGRRKKG